MKKRIFASLLAIVMAFSLLPASALAANATVKITEGSGTESLLTNPESIKCCRFIGMEGIIILRQIIW